MVGDLNFSRAGRQQRSTCRRSTSHESVTQRCRESTLVHPPNACRGSQLIPTPLMKHGLAAGALASRPDRPVGETGRPDRRAAFDRSGFPAAPIDKCNRHTLPRRRRKSSQSPAVLKLLLSNSPHSSAHAPSGRRSFWPAGRGLLWPGRRGDRRSRRGPSVRIRGAPARR